RDAAAAAKPGPLRCGVERRGYLLVGPGCGCGCVPNGTVRLAGERLGERPMRISKLRRVCRLLYRRADQGMPESKSPRLERAKPGGDSGRQVVLLNGPPRRAGQLVEVDPVERREQEQLLHSGVEARESRRECLLESAGEREWVGPRRLHPERGRSDRKLDQGEGVALRLFEDPAPDICRKRRRAEVEECVRRPW